MEQGDRTIQQSPARSILAHLHRESASRLRARIPTSSFDEVISMRAASRDDSERLLIERCIAGEEIAWGKLFNAQQPRLLRVLRARWHLSQAQAEEAAQQMWYSLWKNHGRALRFYDQQRGSLLTFLATLALKAHWHAKRTRPRRVRETVCPLHGHEQILARAFQVSTELMIDDFCASLPVRRAAFVKTELLKSRTIVPARRRHAHRKMVQRALASLVEFLELQ
jgi:hypothetical protein